jgi:hypothetical protein
MKPGAMGMAAGLLLAFCAGCGNNVQGNTYANSMMKVQFQSGSKAVVTIGFMTQNCQWSQNSKNVTVNCAGDTTQFTLNDDGSLAGPPEGMIGRLTKVKS